ncbi:PQQ-binding-like beta-propeller repeat protein [Bythopirellula polymerisocia]|uniref:Outer membrane protein assembly factor BamB n=1 Tax=Bythopirellula polymerisocia TaxID=2528003 RepID=A0A5C6CXM5_9BACT|nr:PQQ-binding-like beta-propeller repeat protein [Bythopirellula polymerisocia]TWU27389.1 Outer membrane protein assembly factor BamB precursor [Bythopirellula polymerisocia]
MRTPLATSLLFLATIFFPSNTSSAENSDQVVSYETWPQWRGPHRDGKVSGDPWPVELKADNLKLQWRVQLGPSYSGPIVSGDLVYTTESRDGKSEVVLAFNRKTGKEIWRAEWDGAMSVPFFAASNGSWIRSTPACDGEQIYIAGMRDVLVCLDAKQGTERWRVDFSQQFSTPLPSFGFVCSPLVDARAVYVQAGASVAKIDKNTGEVLWRALQDEGGMNGSAFSSPVIAELAGKTQLVVQTREFLAGLDMQTGAELWRQPVPSFRGMNILTPVVVGDAIFTSSYQNKSWLYKITNDEENFSSEESWSNNAKGYMSTPVIIEGHAYLHLQNERFACINLESGERTWTSEPYGKYCSMIANGNRILALESSGRLLLINANPQEFKLIDELKVSDSETWAHLAISGDQIFVRELDGLATFRWK